MVEIERRSTPSPLGRAHTQATRGKSGAQSFRLIGTAAVFDEETIISDLFLEQIHPRAFDEALSRPDDVRALFNHDPNILLGRTTSGTLKLSTNAKGLQYEIDLPNTTAARDLHALVMRGDINGSSFGFRVDDDVWTKGAAGELPLRTVTRASLVDVSPVSFPAYTSTTVSARSKAEKMTTGSRAERDRLTGILAREKLSDEISLLQRWQPPKFRSKPTVIGTLVGTAAPIDAIMNTREASGFSGAKRYAAHSFRETLAQGGQVLKLNHDQRIPARYRWIAEHHVGVYAPRAGEVSGLNFEVDIFDSAIGREMLAGVRSGAIQHCSIGYRDQEGIYDRATWVVSRVHLGEISLLKGKAPAAWGTRVGFADSPLGRLGEAVADLRIARAA